MDEQLHAGFFFYILTGPSRFVSNTIFIWAIVAIAFGVMLPYWLTYISYCEKNTVHASNRSCAVVFMILNYGLALCIFMLPGYLLGENSKDHCLAQSDQLKQERASALSTTLQAMLIGPLLLLVLFKTLQPGKQTHLWLEVKQLHAWVQTAFLSAFILFAYPFSLLILCINLVFTKARPLGNPEGLTGAKWLVQVVASAVWMSVTGAVLVLLVFGTSIDLAGKRNESALGYGAEFLKDLIMNYHCIGHRLWFFVCFIVVPSWTCLIKILTN